MDPPHQQTIWLDCDPGLDDTFAILYAAHAPELHLLGVSTSPGNTNLHNTTQNALNVLYNCGKQDVPVYPGSNRLIKGQMVLAQHMHGSNGLGGVQLPVSPSHAIKDLSFQKIYHRIATHEGKIIWLNTGSLTNLCILLLTYPHFKEKLEKIVLMGGAIGKGNITPAAQFNIYFDPHAFSEVLRLKQAVPMVMIPLQVTHLNIATPEIFHQVSKHKNIPFACALRIMLQQYRTMYYNAYKLQNPPIHDPLTVFYVLHPQEFEVKQTHIEVDMGKTSYGRTNFYFDSPIHPNIAQGSVNFVATDLKNHQYKFWTQMLYILEHIFSSTIQQKITT